MRDAYGKTRLFVQAEGWDQEALAALEGVESVSKLTTGEYKLILEDENIGPELFKTISKGEYIQSFSQQPPTLDEIFKMEAGGRHEK